MLRGALIVGLFALTAAWSIALDAPHGTLAIGPDGTAISTGVDSAPPRIDGSQQANDDGDDTSMRVQLWTVLAAGIAAGVGLLLYLVRVILGRVQPPPAQHQDEAHR